MLHNPNSEGGRTVHRVWQLRPPRRRSFLPTTVRGPLQQQDEAGLPIPLRSIGGHLLRCKYRRGTVPSLPQERIRPAPRPAGPIRRRDGRRRRDRRQRREGWVGQGGGLGPPGAQCRCARAMDARKGRRRRRGQRHQHHGKVGERKEGRKPAGIGRGFDRCVGEHGRSSGLSAREGGGPSSLGGGDLFGRLFLDRHRSVGSIDSGGRADILSEALHREAAIFVTKKTAERL
mmetsp:Transcript_15109/g.25191  ORF Transcript_15109/g.25191 Transcript_15109/m.25191 type:complete len:231 (+) Transcript_15109:348-1040(+)